MHEEVMKELSIEQKAKRYDEAIERAKEMINDMTNIGGVAKVDDIQYLFPELKESEGEKIRKEIIAFLTYYHTGQGNSVKYDDGWIAWLEKQKPIGWSEEDSIICQEVIHVIDNCERFEQERNHENCVDFHHYQVLREWLKFLSNKYISQQPKQDEQKPTDKVEPKFKVEKEKWYVCISQYCNCIEGRNYKASLDGRIIDDYGTEYDMHDDAYRWFRPWTIQDAKDGDVLSYSDNRNNVYLCIYREYKNERVYDYCTLDKESFWEHGNWNYLASFNYAPATKEQRDQLKKAMADAGYTFDFDKKELKKIEQNHAWSEEDKEMLEDTCRILSNSKECTTSNVRWLKSLRPQNKWKPSGFHLECISDAIAMYQERGINAIGLKEILEELKKLKEE